MSHSLTDEIKVFIILRAPIGVYFKKNKLKDYKTFLQKNLLSILNILILCMIRTFHSIFNLKYSAVVQFSLTCDNKFCLKLISKSFISIAYLTRNKKSSKNQWKVQLDIFSNMRILQFGEYTKGYVENANLDFFVQYLKIFSCEFFWWM